MAVSSRASRSAADSSGADVELDVEDAERRQAFETMLPMMNEDGDDDRQLDDPSATCAPSVSRRDGHYFATPSRCASRFASDAPELRAPSMKPTKA